MRQGLHYKMTVRLLREEKAFGPGIARLLEEIQKTGSMHQAAKNMGLSYSKAWKIMKTAERELGFALTERSTGGREGGGSVITQEGLDMMTRYKAFLLDLEQEADHLFRLHFEKEGEA